MFEKMPSKGNWLTTRWSSLGELWVLVAEVLFVLLQVLRGVQHLGLLGFLHHLEPVVVDRLAHQLRVREYFYRAACPHRGDLLLCFVLLEHLLDQRGAGLRAQVQVLLEGLELVDVVLEVVFVPDAQDGLLLVLAAAEDVVSGSELAFFDLADRVEQLREGSATL